jgi:hypothetical protein
VSHSTEIPRTRPLALGDWMNFFLMTEANSTENLWQVVSQQIDVEKCGKVKNNNNKININNVMLQKTLQ